MEEFIAIIKIFAGNFAPRGFAYCQGQLIGLNTNTALFSLIGTTYGGNGETNFALPDLRGRMPIGIGQGPGLSNFVLGQKAGAENVTLTTAQMPQHNHPLTGVTSNSTQAGTAVAANGDAITPTNNYLALSPKIGSGPNATQLKTYATAAPSPVKLGGGAITTTTNATIGLAGSGQSFSIMQPYLAINYIICLEGIYPSRN